MSLGHHGSRARLWASALLFASCSQVFAETEVLLEERFKYFSTGVFERSGSVSAGFSGIRMSGSLRTSNITSPVIDTVGYKRITLTFERSTRSLDAGEAGVAFVSLDGQPFHAVESTRDTTREQVTVELTGEMDRISTVQVRFGIAANGLFESYTVDNVVIAGEPVGTAANSAQLPPTGDFVTFESGHVRPMALSSDGTRLYVVNTPDHRVEIFDVTTPQPRLLESVRVGLEPVALALRNDRELWVVNHLSDSVSVVDVGAMPATVTRTLFTGDEPRDIVFGGKDQQWAFITAAHRGQNVPFDPQLTTPGVGRADVWVFDAADQGVALGGTPLTILNMFGDTLRALAAGPDGETLYAAVFNSGNRSTVMTADILRAPLEKAPPFVAADGVEQPRTGLIVQYDGRHWMDGGDPVSGVAPRAWDDRIRLELPDYDVFKIDASGSLPVVSERISGVGTTLFNMVVNPASGHLYVSNQEALNLTRFEGFGENSTTVRGHFVESRVTVVDGSQVAPRHLNKHIDYSRFLGTEDERARAVAIPLEMAVTADGGALYLAAMGSGKLVRYETDKLEDDQFVPALDDQLKLSQGGATGVVLDEARQRAFVTTRFDNGVSVIDISGARMQEVAHVAMHNPEPAIVQQGRPFLYDTEYTSSRGDSSCAGCHVFGDMDHLSWDLGDPGMMVVDNPNRYNPQIPGIGRNDKFHPMKGPMSTQSFRGLKGNGPMHWRGDRTGVNRDPDETLEEQAFEDFIVAFEGLLGRSEPLTEAEMDAFAKFVLELTYPPNPIAALDNALDARQASALHIYDTVTADFISTCNGCHVLDPLKGHFGTDGGMSIEGPEVDENVKIPHLRNVYQKVGMFATNSMEDRAVEMGPQIRGFGFGRIGGAGTAETFLSTLVFSALSEEQVKKLEELSLAYPSNMNPVVGQQVTVNPTNHHLPTVHDRVQLLIERALVTQPRPECDLVASARLGGSAASWVMNSESQFVPARSGAAALPYTALMTQTIGAGEPVTFTCVPPGNGVRAGLDRNLDGVFDLD